jgi:hypothetical protein
MRGFETEGPVPEWLSQCFNESTTLPKGPLEHLPVPLEGAITSASSSMPADGRYYNWSVNIRCLEPVEQASRFYEEYLPLAGYDIVAVGSIRIRRTWLSRARNAADIFVIHRDGYFGSVTLRTAPEGTHTQIEVVAGHPKAEPFKTYADHRMLLQDPDIHWRSI